MSNPKNLRNEVQFPEGMTLRDYFAARAMEAIILRTNWQEKTLETLPYQHIAFAAYAMADAMLKVRQFRPGSWPPPQPV